MSEKIVETRLKQRVIGAVVLTALAIIILPMLLDGTQEERMQVVADIPEPPPIEITQLTTADVLSAITTMEQESEARLPVPESEAEVDVAPKALQLDANNLPVGWSLQIASFRNQVNAVKLREQLRAGLYKAYITRAETGDGATYRVLIGPMLQKEKLAEIAEAVENEFQLKGQIVRYRIDEDKGQLGG